MAKVVPSLDITDKSSWVSGPLARGRRLLANYLTTDRWQSHSYEYTVHSSVDILQEKQDDPFEMVTLVEESLTKLFKLHFDNVSVSVSIDPSASNTLNIGISWQQDGTNYSISSYTFTTGDTLTRVVNEHNTGNPNNEY